MVFPSSLQHRLQVSLPLLLDRSSSWGWKLFRREISQGHMLKIRKQANPKWKLQNMECVCFTKKTTESVTITVYINPLIPKEGFLQSVSEKTTFLKKPLSLKSQPKVPKEAKLSQHSVHYPADQRACCEFSRPRVWASAASTCLQFMLCSPKVMALKAQSMNQFRQQKNLSRHSCAEIFLLSEQHCTVAVEHLPPREETLRKGCTKKDH